MMNASHFMDKQIMDLTQLKSSNNFIDLMNSQPKEVLAEEDEKRGNDIGAGTDKDEILPSYDFHPICPIGVSSSYSDAAGAPAAATVSGNVIAGGSARTWNSMETMSKTPLLRNYGHLDPVVPDKAILEKAQNMNDSALISKIDWTMKKHTDNLMHAMDGLSTQLVQLENRMSQLENSLDGLKLFVGNSLGSTDGKMRQLDNILCEVQDGVQNLKDKQQVMEAQMLLAKLQVPKVNQEAPEKPSTTRHVDPVQQVASQQSNQQFPVALEPSVPGPPLSPPQQIVHPPMPLPNQFPQGQIPALTKQDTYFLPNQMHEIPHPEYQVPPVPLFKPAPAPAPAPVLPASAPAEHQLVQPPPPLSYAQHSSIPQQYPPAAPVNLPPQFQASALGHHPEETGFISSQSFSFNLQQPQPNAGPTKQFYPAPPHLYEPNPSRSSSGYIPTAGPSDPYSYSRPASRYDTSSSPKPHSYPSGAGSNNAPIPTARLLPQAIIPTASPVGGGPGSDRSGNRVPIDDVVDKVTNMGFPRDHVRATVKKLTENGQSVDLNVVLDKLMNDGDVQPPRGWFGH